MSDVDRLLVERMARAMSAAERHEDEADKAFGLGRMAGLQEARDIFASEPQLEPVMVEGDYFRPRRDHAPSAALGGVLQGHPSDRRTAVSEPQNLTAAEETDLRHQVEMGYSIRRDWAPRLLATLDAERDKWDSLSARAVGAVYALVDSLDSVWAEAEASLPDGWAAAILPVRGGGHDEPPYEVYRAFASLPLIDRGLVQTELEPTPAAALRALAAKLRERQP